MPYILTGAWLVALGGRGFKSKEDLVMEESSKRDGGGSGGGTRHLSDVLLEILEREAKETSGLFLVDMPTGYGKSFAAQELLGSFCARQQGSRKVFYITPQKKNLPKLGDVERAFANAGFPDVPRHAVLMVRPLHEMLAETASPAVLGYVPDRFWGMAELERLMREAEAYRRCGHEGEFGDSRYEEYVRDRLLKAERTFRGAITSELEADVPDTPDEMMRLIDEKEDWQWLGRLYPTVFTERARVLIMSFDKFLYNHITLVRKPYRLIDSPLSKGALVIIDEFDSSKEDLLDKIVQDSVEAKVDLPELIRSMHVTFASKERPRSLVRSSEARKKNGGNEIDDLLDAGKKVVASAFDDANLRYEYKAEGSDGKANYLFYDFRYTALCGAEMEIVIDDEERVNSLRRTQGGTAHGKSLRKTLGSMRGAARRMCGICSQVALNYWQRMQQANTKGNGAITLESAQRTVLDWLGIDREEHKLYMIAGMRSRARGNARRARSQTDLSVYGRGIHVVEMVDSDEHDVRTRVEMCAVQTSPEAILLRLMVRSRVIGLSATSTLDSVLCNYDLSYLRRQGGDVTFVSEDDLARLREAYEAQNAGYDQIEICVVEVPTVSSVTEWQHMLGNGEAGRAAHDKIPSSTKQFMCERYGRVAYAYQYFLEHDEVMSMLALTMPAPRRCDGHDGFDRDVLTKIFEDMAKNKGCYGRTDQRVFFIEGSRVFGKDHDAIKSHLSNGGRAFVVASYLTLGTGVNLQYPTPPGSNTVEVYDAPWSNERDYDAIYLDRPTNLAPYIRTKYTDEVFVNDLFETCELLERGEISLESHKGIVEAIGKARVSGKKGARMPVSLMDTSSAKAKATRTVNQALGRICRTSRKSPVIHILYDSDLANRVDAHALDGRMVNREYAALVSRLATNEGDDDGPKNTLEVRAKTLSTRLNDRIQGLVRESTWSQEAISTWIELRELVLAHPTIAVKTGCDALVYDTYIELDVPRNSYTYEQTGDFTNVDISFADRVLPREVSLQAARTEALRRNPLIRKHFGHKGWPLEWEPGRFIMSPVLFNNIYLGALGEQVGKLILEHYVPNLRLEEIEDGSAFEKFDFRIAGTSTYVDLKYWLTPSGEDEDEAAAWIMEKMQAIGADRVMVVNALGRSSDSYKCKEIGGGRILTVPALVFEEDGSVSVEAIEAIRGWLERGEQA